MFRTRLLTCAISVLFACLGTSHSILAFELVETAPAGSTFAEIVVRWTDKNNNVVAQTRVENVGDTAIFDSRDPERAFKLPEGTIRDWKQHRKLNTGQESDLEGVFSNARRPMSNAASSDLSMSYEEAYALLGLNSGDLFFLPDFSADVDNDNFAETALFSAINLFDLASNFPQFINNQPFTFGQAYSASNFADFGFVFSLSDNIQFDASLGEFVTPTPLPLSTFIIADSEHITGIVPEPSSSLLLATSCAGLLGYGWRRRLRRRKSDAGRLGGTPLRISEAASGPAISGDFDAGRLVI